jgi:hypothetical protein
MRTLKDLVNRVGERTMLLRINVRHRNGKYHEHRAQLEVVTDGLDYWVIRVFLECLRKIFSIEEQYR